MHVYEPSGALHSGRQKICANPCISRKPNFPPNRQARTLHQSQWYVLLLGSLAHFSFSPRYSVIPPAIGSFDTCRGSEWVDRTYPPLMTWRVSLRGDMKIHPVRYWAWQHFFKLSALLLYSFSYEKSIMFGLVYALKGGNEVEQIIISSCSTFLGGHPTP